MHICRESCKYLLVPKTVNDLNLFALSANKTHRDGQLVSQWRDVDMKVVIEPIFNSQSYFQQPSHFYQAENHK